MMAGGMEFGPGTLSRCTFVSNLWICHAVGNAVGSKSVTTATGRALFCARRVGHGMGVPASILENCSSQSCCWARYIWLSQQRKGPRSVRLGALALAEAVEKAKHQSVVGKLPSLLDVLDKGAIIGLNILPDLRCHFFIKRSSPLYKGSCIQLHLRPISKT